MSSPYEKNAPSSSPASNPEVKQIPLVVDLDGTLLHTDSLLEEIIDVLRGNALRLVLFAYWLMRGKAFFKTQIAQRASLDIKSLPYNNDLLEYLRQESRRGRKIILATAANEVTARRIADHLGLFSIVLASDERINLRGLNKLRAIQAATSNGAFAYVANCSVDLPIWRHAREAIPVNCGQNVERKLRRVTAISRTFPKPHSSLALLRALRPVQWLKNGLLFVPVFTAHEWFNATALAHASLAFVAFCVAASGTYVLNDLVDLPSDRRHRSKRLRPLARGEVPIAWGIALALALPALGVAIAFYVSAAFAYSLLTYLGMALVYSFWVKRLEIVDIITLAAMYTLRIIAGALAIGVPLSFWLLAFSMFLFLSLALVKRCTELHSLPLEDNRPAPGRRYWRADLEYLHGMGVASGYLSILVLALFINNSDITANYARPQVLWLLCPLMLYWITRLWLKVGRQQVDDDPIIFTLRDWPSQITFIAAVALTIAAL